LHFYYKLKFRFKQRIKSIFQKKEKTIFICMGWLWQLHKIVVIMIDG